MPRCRQLSLHGILLALVLISTTSDAIGDSATRGALERAAIPGSAFALIQSDVEAGILDEREALLQSALALFGRAELDPRYRTDEPTPIKCGTWILEDIRQRTEGIYPELTALLEDEFSAKAAAAIYVSPSGLFHYSYDVVPALNGVPAADADLSGVPDFVEWIDDYLVESWDREVTQMGFAAPDLLSSPLPVQFRTWGGGLYGLTRPGAAEIWLNASFQGMPPNTDPDGNVKGAAKVTCAHELKHVLQYESSGWVDSRGWLEADAVWAEEFVYDDTNDYYNYLPSATSPFNHPEIGLFDGNVEYEDANWQIFISELHGDVVNLAFWERRTLVLGGESVRRSFAAVFGARGLVFADEFARYMAWNYLSGARAADGVGYGEAANYPTSLLQDNTSVLPLESSINLAMQPMSGRFHQVNLPPSATGEPVVVFDGQDNTTYRLNLVLQSASETRIEPVAVNGNNDADVQLAGIEVSGYDRMGLIVANPDYTSATTSRFSYDLSMDVAEPDTSQPQTPVAFALGIPAPHPMVFETGSSLVSYTVGTRGRVTAELYDLRGRLVRTVYRGDATSIGEQSPLVIDGRDDNGNLLASGLYLLRVRSANSEISRPFVLVK